ncbi:MAG: hypothetical protein OK454_00160 [Thaumarchaeota archaeon]|nr:hypothetical protein [Nitrososphaerota archaeon]
MSADNWTTCPACYDKAQKEAIEEHERVANLYGVISVEEFDAERAALPDIDPQIDSTFREDYEFYGASQGEIHYIYKGRCMTCDCKIKVEGSERFYGPYGRSGETT